MDLAELALEQRTELEEVHLATSLSQTLVQNIYICLRDLRILQHDIDYSAIFLIQLNTRVACHLVTFSEKKVVFKFVA